MNKHFTDTLIEATEENNDFALQAQGRKRLMSHIPKEL